MNITKFTEVALLKRLKIITTALIFILIAIQFVIIILYGNNQVADAAAYLHLAKQSFNFGYYPNSANINDIFIFNPGIVNYFMLLLHISDNTKILCLFNIIWSLILLFSIRYLTYSLFHNPFVTELTIFFYCFSPVFWVEAGVTKTELPYTALVFLGLALIFSGKKYNIMIAGIVLALSNWIRPLTIAFLLGGILYLVLSKNRKLIFALVGCYILLIILIGIISYIYTGYFIYQSTTAGFNLVMGANDDADGSFENTCFQEGKIAYLPPEIRDTMTFAEKDNYYKKIAISWILKNPVKWFLLFPKKIFYMYGTEEFYSRLLFSNNADRVSHTEYITSMPNRIFSGKANFVDFYMIYSQITYMIILIGFVICIIVEIKRRECTKLIPLLIAFFIGSSMTLVIVGGARYHVPFEPILIIFAAMAYFEIYKFLKSSRNRI